MGPPNGFARRNQVDRGACAGGPRRIRTAAERPLGKEARTDGPGADRSPGESVIQACWRPCGPFRGSGSFRRKCDDWPPADSPLPIGHHQTISQPYIVAFMTELLRIEKGHRVLEIGTGSGYQSAVLAELSDHVHSIEIVPALAARAAVTLRELGYSGVKVKHGDGYLGWPEHGPLRPDHRDGRAARHSRGRSWSSSRRAAGWSRR